MGRPLPTPRTFPPTRSRFLTRVKGAFECVLLKIMQKAGFGLALDWQLCGSIFESRPLVPILPIIGQGDSSSTTCAHRHRIDQKQCDKARRTIDHLLPGWESDCGGDAIGGARS